MSVDNSKAVIATGYRHTGVILNDGTIKLWGEQNYGALGNNQSSSSAIGNSSGETPDNLTAIGPGTFGVGRTVTSIACGDSITGVVLDNGEVWTTGRNSNGALGRNGTTNQSTFGQVSIGGSVTAVDIACGDHHMMIITGDGRIKAWGLNNAGQCFTGNNTSPMTPQTDDTYSTLDTSGHIDITASGGQYPGNGNYSGRTAKQICCGKLNSYVLLDNGSVISWGDGDNHALGTGSTSTIGTSATHEFGNPYTAADASSSPLIHIAAGSSFFIGCKANGSITVWGLNNYGHLGLGNTSTMSSDTTISAFPSSATAIAVGATQSNAFVVLNDYTLLICGQGNYGMLGNNSDTQSYGDGGSETWANATAVDLGDGRTISSSTVKKAISKGNGITQSHIGVVLDNETFLMWGNNNSGELGLGDGNNHGDNTDEVENAVVNLGTDLYISGYSSGSGGDPYIRTADGRFYKMDNFTGFFRLVQGELGGKQLTINGYCQLDDVDRESGCNEIISDVIRHKNIQIPEKIGIQTKIDGEMRDASVYQTTDLANQSFIKVIYIRYGDDELILRLEPKLEIILNNSSIEIEKTSMENGLSFIPMYKDMKADTNYLLKINSIDIIISYYKNPQIRNGFMMRDVRRMKNANGILVNTLDKKHSEIDNLDSHEPVHNEDIPLKTQNCEFFLDSDDTNAVQKNYAIKGYQTGIPIGHDVSNIAIVL